MSSASKSFLGHVLLALLLAFIWRSTAVPSGEPFPTGPRPFVTTAEMLAVHVRIPAEGAPEIVEVNPLASGRLTVTGDGPYMLQVLDKNGAVTYELAFSVMFEPPGLHGHALKEVSLLFIVPGRDTVQVRISGPSGTAAWELRETAIPEKIEQ